MTDPEDKKIPVPESDTGNGEPPEDDAAAAAVESSADTDTGNGEPPPK